MNAAKQFLKDKYQVDSSLAESMTMIGAIDFAQSFALSLIDKIEKEAEKETFWNGTVIDLNDLKQILDKYKEQVK